MGSKSPQVTGAGCAAVETVAQALRRYPEALETLHGTFPQIAPSDVTLSFAACARLPTTLTPVACLNDSLTARFDHAFGAQIARSVAPSTSCSTPSQFIIGVRLIGMLAATSMGTLAIRHPSSSGSALYSDTTSNTTPQAISFLIAPAPPPHFHGVPVFVSDWRFLPAHRDTRSPPLFEALQQDVHILIRPCPPLTPLSVPLSPQISFEKDVLVSFHATVIAKSPTFKSSSSSRRFFIEVASPDPSKRGVGVFIVFDGNAVAWWPFIRPGLCIVFTDLKINIAPGMLHRYLLRTTSGTSVFTFRSLTPQTAPPSSNTKRPLVICESTKRTNKTSIRQGAVVTYEGIITRCLPSALLQLDNFILLNVTELNDTVVGRHPYRTFRVGTRLRVTDVVVVLRPSSPPCLYATVRTFIDILFFADIHATSSVHMTSQWRRMSKRFSLQRIVASEDILSALQLKFRHWFLPLNSAVNNDDHRVITDPGAIGTLLGERERSGLVQYLMFLLGDSEDILHLGRLPVRAIYKEFIAPITLEPQNFKRTLLPTIAEVREAVSRRWDELTNQRCIFQNFRSNKKDDSPEFDKSGRLCGSEGNNGIHEFFNFNTIVDVLLRRKKGCEGAGVALVGLMYGTPDGSRHVVLSDATDSLNVRCVGGLKPSFLGAMVCIHRFNIVGDTQMLSSPTQSDISHGFDNDLTKLGTQEDLTLIFGEEDLSIVVDGPFVHMESDREDNHSNSVVSRRQATQRSPYHVLNISSLSASISKHEQTVLSSDGDVSDAPLICVFVEQVRSGSQCTISGRIMAMMETRSDDSWTVIDNNGAGFWHVDILLQGRAWLKMMACFEEGRLFAISCTQLEHRTNPRAYILKKAFDAHTSGRHLQLTSKMSNSLPWIENLGLGVYLRFTSKTEIDSRVGDESLRLGDLDMSPEGEQYMYISRAVEQFRSKDCTVESKLWKLYEWSTELEGVEERMIHLRGIITRRQLFQNGNGIDACPIEKVTLVDDILDFFPITVCFYDNFTQVHGLTCGMLVILRNVVRVPIKNAREGFEFVGNSATSVKIMSNDFLKTGRDLRQTTCGCGTRGNQSFWKVSEHLNLVFLDEFVHHSDLVAGLIRFYDVRVEWMEVDVHVNTTSGRNCVECSVDQKRDEGNSAQCQIHLEMIAEIDDGSRVALTRCRGMGTCMRMLSASHFQRESIRQLARECGTFEIDMRDGQNALLSRLETRLHDTGMAVWHLLSSRGVGGVVAVLNSSASRPCRTDAHGSGVLDRIVAKWFKMGYGRGMSITCSPANRRLFLDVVGFFEESLLSPGLEDTCKKQQESSILTYPYIVSPTTLLQFALDQRMRTSENSHGSDCQVSGSQGP